MPDKIIIALNQIASAINRLANAVENIGMTTDDPGCQHEHTVDFSMMGDQPGEKVYCNDCQKYLDRTAVDN